MIIRFGALSVVILPALGISMFEKVFQAFRFPCLVFSRFLAASSRVCLFSCLGFSRSREPLSHSCCFLSRFA